MDILFLDRVRKSYFTYRFIFKFKCKLIVLSTSWQFNNKYLLSRKNMFFQIFVVKNCAKKKYIYQCQFAARPWTPQNTISQITFRNSTPCEVARAQRRFQKATNRSAWLELSCLPRVDNWKKIERNVEALDRTAKATSILIRLSTLECISESAHNLYTYVQIRL